MFYIGQAQNFTKRFRRHKSALRKGNHDNSHLQNAFNKYGEAYFTFHIVMRVKEDFLDRYEQWQLDQYWETGRLYNLSPTAGSSRGVKINMSPEKKREFSEKRSKAMMGNTLTLGHKLTPEHIAKVVKSRRKFIYEVKFPFPDRHIEFTNNLAQFARDHSGLDPSALHKVAKGEYSHHQGFRVRRLTPDEVSLLPSGIITV
jgi:group I intron endonuclease